MGTLEDTLEDWNLLSSRNILYFNVSALSAIPVRLSYTNTVVANNNYSMLISLKQKVYVLKAVHNSSKASKLSAEEFSGLQPLFQLSIGARVMLLNNLWTEMGLCNGAMGEVKSLVYKHGVLPPALPIAVLIKFDNYVGPTFFNTGVVPIVPINLTSSGYENCERQQIPLKLSWAVTIHKSQRLTIDKTIVDLGPTEKVAGLAYVALSRVRNMIKFRLMEEKRIDDLDNITQQKFSFLL